MPCDWPCMSHMALYIVSLHIIQTNSRTSTHHWRLDLDEGKVKAMARDPENDQMDHFGHIPDDPLLSILTNKVTNNGEWKLEATEPTCTEDCSKKKYDRCAIII